MVQVMACNLTASSHYLSQCWLIINEVFGIHKRAIPHEMLKIFILHTNLENTNLRLLPRLPGAKELSVTSQRNCNTSDPTEPHNIIYDTAICTENNWRCHANHSFITKQNTSGRMYDIVLTLPSKSKHSSLLNCRQLHIFTKRYIWNGGYITHSKLIY